MPENEKNYVSMCVYKMVKHKNHAIADLVIYCIVSLCSLCNQCIINIVYKRQRIYYLC